MTPRQILEAYKIVAVVGLSPNPRRPSNEVSKFLISRGYTVIPVNPGHREILGQASHRDLLSIGRPVEIVDIFRRSEEVPPIVDQAIEIGARVVWMQLGVIHEAAAEKARAAGLEVVMDRCPMIELIRG